MATPFQQQRQAQPFSPIESISTAFGTAAESAVDTVSFGLVSPDIIPQAQEQQHPWATTVGRVIGNVVGFVAPGFGALTTTGRAIQGATYAGRYFNVTRKAIGLAKLTTGAVTKGSTIARGAFTIGKLGSTFAVHDASREFIRQIQEDDPNMYEIGKKAIQGGIAGGLVGFTAGTVANSAPVLQALSVGTTMTMAETLNDIGDGVDVFDKAYWTERAPMAFLQGAMIGAYNSRGYKARQKMQNTNALEDGMRRIMQDPKQLQAELEKIGGEAFAKKNLPKELIALSESLAKRGTRGFSSDPIKAKAQFQKVMSKAKFSQEAQNDYIRAVTGKKNISKITKEEMVEVTNALQTNIDNYGIHINMGGPLQNLFSPADRLFLTSGMGDMVSMRNLKLAKEISIVQQSAMGEFSFAARRLVNEGYKKAFPKLFKETGKVGEAFGFDKGIKKTLKGQASKAEVEFHRQLTYDPTKPPSNVNQKPIISESQLTPELRDMKRLYKTVTKVFANRQNEVLVMMGQKPIPVNDFYVRRTIDRAAMIAAGMEPPVEDFNNIFADKAKPAGRFTVSTEKQRTTQTEKFIYKEDPFSALDDMVRHDLKRIYLTKPQAIVSKELEIMVKTGQMTAAEGEYVTRYVNTVFLSQPTLQTKRFDAFLKKKMEGNAGKGIVKLAAEWGKDIGSSPTAMMANLYGSAVTKAYMGGRARLAIRNSMQSLFTFGMVDTPSLAKAMTDTITWKVTPKRYQEWQNTNQGYKMSKGNSMEHIEAMSPIDQVLLGPFHTSHIMNVDISSLGTYYQTMKYITDPKFAKTNFSDKAGRAIRSKLKSEGNAKWNDAISSTEKARLFKEVEFVTLHTQFLYNAVGMPMISRSKVAAPFVKLASFPMNYAYKYLGELTHRMKTGQPRWAKGTDIKLPWNNRLGLVKHALAGATVVAGLDLLGFDYSSIVGAGYLPKQNKAFVPFIGYKFDEFAKDRYMTDTDQHRAGEKIPLHERVLAGLSTPEGVLTARPTLGMSTFMAMKNLFSNDRYLKQKAVRDLPTLLVPVPGMKLKGDIERAAKDEDQLGFFAQRPFTPKKKKRSPTTPFPKFKVSKPRAF